MIMNDDELIFDDFDEFDDEPSNQEPDETPSNGSEQDDLTGEVLKLKGIEDPNKIKFEDYNGAIVERAWDSLSKEEQLNILAGSDVPEDTDLDDSEIDLLNAIRSSGMSIEDYLNDLVQKQVQQMQVPQQQTFKIDELSDDEVYALDLLEKVGAENISDDELTEAVKKAKENSTLFSKTVEGLRNEYKQLQQDEEARELNAYQAQQQEAYQNFSASIIDQIQNLNSFAGQQLEMTQEDAETLAQFMLDIDDQGMSPFGRALQDPELFTKAAFWLLHENEIVEELTRQMQDTYKLGYEAAKRDMSGSKVVFQPKNETSSKKEIIFDDDWD